MGVKSLWTLLTPVGRPIMLETAEGKTMAIDSSIWIYQFQATMRDKDGRALVNAHVLGFLRRITKLLFYGIKPVFVFDGGAPTLKRTTLNERRKKKSGAAASHAKIAEKLLAAQMRREALNHAIAESPKGKGKAATGSVNHDGDLVYLEDIDPSIPKALPRKKAPDSASASPKKSKFHDHDPYRLPDINLEEAVAKATRSVAPDPRLATEEELRSFIEDMRPEDFDVTSPAFRELPTEVQYEIVGDLRLKSRQTSYARLQKMLQSAPTPLDFSKQQIKNLRQRNTLTQQLLVTTDSIGSAHIAIPIRIANERNRQYVLMKNEGENGGWILGIRDNGTAEKPIEIDQGSDEGVEDGDSDADMEEVDVSAQPASADPDLREYQRNMALSAIAGRYAPKELPRVTTRPHAPTQRPNPLFDLDEEEDEDLAIAVQQSLDYRNSAPGNQQPPLHHASSSSTHSQASSSFPPNTSKPISSNSFQSPPLRQNHKDVVSFSPSGRLETALSIANAGPYRRPASQAAGSAAFGQPVLLTSPFKSTSQHMVSDSEDGLGHMALLPSFSPKNTPESSTSSPSPLQTLSSLPEETPMVPLQEDSDSDSGMEDVTPGTNIPSSLASAEKISPASRDIIAVDTGFAANPDFQEIIPLLTPEASHGEAEPHMQPEPLFDTHLNNKDDDEPFIPWSRSPSPGVEPAGDDRPPYPAGGGWDAAQEMDARAEEGEFVKFMSQVNGRDPEDVRREIDDEIKSLNQQKRAAMRDSEDVTQQMITQIMTMLRLFGIPYITAPMEAEAQCAELVSLGLVDGVITDDSDVFLFGAQRVFKNMFNQSKTVECFLLTDLARELGLDRDTLIRLAYLLGSDYVEGLPGVGPVVAMELLREFPGENGLHKFKEWWLRVQTGRDKEEDNKSKFRKQFKRKFKELYLPDDWPNSAVRDAYYHPTVDSSDEPFKWGLPDLDALREFFREELSWHKEKVDDLLLPIIQKMNKRGQAAALNKQSNLNEFFDVSAGSGTFAPRKRQAYASKRLQQVVSDFRKRKSRSSTPPTDVNGDGQSSGGENEPPAKKRGETTASTSRGTAAAGVGRGKSKRGRGRGGGRGVSTRKKVTSSDEDEFPTPNAGGAMVPTLAVGLRPRPKPRPIGKTAKNSAQVDG